MYSLKTYAKSFKILNIYWTNSSDYIEPVFERKLVEILPRFWKRKGTEK